MKMSRISVWCVFGFLSTVKNAFSFCQLKQVGHKKSSFEVSKKLNDITSVIFAIIAVLVLIDAVINNPFKKSAEVCFDNNACFKAQVADTEEKRQEGLMFRTSLKENEAMLFVFPQEAIYPFWMKNTLIPLDIIWINEENRIVHIEKNAMPCGDTCNTINPQANALYVLEINAGLAEKYNITEDSFSTISLHNN